MGFNYEDTASRWRRDRSLSTEASDGLGPRLEMKRSSNSDTTYNHGFPGNLDGLPSLVINAARRGESCSVSAVNFSPRPPEDFACRTRASALIGPSGTRKSILAFSPTGFAFDVAMHKPPALRSRTRETSSRPSHCQ